MARRPRIDYPGAWHHVMHRGARRAPIFGSDDHCGTFLGHVAATVEVFEVEVHAYSSPMKRWVEALDSRLYDK